MARYLFVTGKLAAQSLVDCLKRVADIDYEIAVLPISVAALMDANFIAKHLTGSTGCDRIMVPGLCEGNLDSIANKTGVEVMRGPKSLKDIPAYFGSAQTLTGYGEHRVKILAEIVDAHKMSMEEILARAVYFRSSGADIIDLGCPVEEAFPAIDAVVSALKEAGFLVSVDSFNPEDIQRADKAGVDYVLSVNSRNLDLARHLRCKVVVIPDMEEGPNSLDRNIRQLDEWQIPYIIDPILRPIGFGFTDSIEDAIRFRRKYPRSEMLLGVGNITELTDADTTGMNALLAGIITELDIDYVLTTEVIGWARGSVRELDLARQLMYYAKKNQVLPKHLNDALLTIKDPPFETYSEDELRAMQAKIRDRHYRIFADREFIYVFNSKVFIKDTDITAIFDRLGMDSASHAFYLGRELQKALLAVRLGKKYVQEEELRWGYLSR
jgi:dihydropteroate synthase-like protein